MVSFHVCTTLLPLQLINVHVSGVSWSSVWFGHSHLVRCRRFSWALNTPQFSCMLLFLSLSLSRCPLFVSSFLSKYQSVGLIPLLITKEGAIGCV
ncbi:hypothetical protein K2173_019187 [Erythroxylum novogranatense]|uniref:Secreted protein n=1 Tax=Erythroxylum novogranatense TaxID=1862640 RepID=A0AAV8STQ0_9ROSI|nr:hypothetical protein K2173_019187 [Erythroxylum novogranatense]